MTSHLQNNTAKLACCHIVKWPLVLTPDQADRLCVVLVAARNPLNIGAAARAMSNFGFHRLRVVNPYDIAFREARSAVGAADLLASAEEYSSVAEAVADCALVVGTTAARQRELHQPLKLLPEASRQIAGALGSGRVALLLGSEKRGLSNQDLSHCHWLLRIPTDETRSSMNLGQAVAVCLYELARGRPSTRKQTLKLARAAEQERITVALLEVLNLSGYVAPGAEASTGAKVRRLVRRLHLQPDDALLLLGMLRQISWKLRSQPGTPRSNTGGQR